MFDFNANDAVVKAENEILHIIETEIADMTPQHVFEKYIACPRGSIAEMLLERTIVGARFGLMSKIVGVAQHMANHNVQLHRVSKKEIFLVCDYDDLGRAARELLQLRAQKASLCPSSTKSTYDALLKGLCIVNAGDIGAIRRHASQCTNVRLLAALVTGYFDSGEIKGSIACEERWLALTYTHAIPSCCTH